MTALISSFQRYLNHCHLATATPGVTAKVKTQNFRKKKKKKKKIKKKKFNHPVQPQYTPPDNETTTKMTALISSFQRCLNHYKKTTATHPPVAFPTCHPPTPSPNRSLFCS
jgi:hypothetical protein